MLKKAPLLIEAFFRLLKAKLEKVHLQANKAGYIYIYKYTIYIHTLYRYIHTIYIYIYMKIYIYIYIYIYICMYVFLKLSLLLDDLHEAFMHIHEHLLQFVKKGQILHIMKTCN